MDSTAVGSEGVRACPSNQSPRAPAVRPKAIVGTARIQRTEVIAAGCRPWSGASGPRPRKARSQRRVAYAAVRTAAISPATRIVQPAAAGATSRSPKAVCSAATRTASLEKKPANGGMAASARRATVIVQ
ncbi:hypothetical protein GCM10020227_43520 [Streptomyces flavovirens]